MNAIETIRYLHSTDGPSMPLRAIAPYVGVSQASLSNYLDGLTKPKPETLQKMEKGLQDLFAELSSELHN